MFVNGCRSSEFPTRCRPTRVQDAPPENGSGHSPKPRHAPVYPGRRAISRLGSRKCPTRVSARPTRGGRRADRESRGLPPPWRPLRPHMTNCSLGRGAGSPLRIPSILAPHPMAGHRWRGAVVRGCLRESARTAGPGSLPAGSDPATGTHQCCSTNANDKNVCACPRPGGGLNGTRNSA